MNPSMATALPGPDELPLGRHHWMIQLGTTPLDQPLAVPVMTLRGARPGPVLALTAAVHGNELNGIRVIHRLMEKLDAESIRGTIVGVVVVNVPGLLQRSRSLGGKDLNHAFPGRDGGDEISVYAYRLRERVLHTADALIDLHTASFGRVNSLYVRADLRDPMSASMAARQRPDLVVHTPPADGTLRGSFARDGIPAITLEIGNPHRIQADMTRRALAGVRANLEAMGMSRKRKRNEGAPPLVCSSSEWLYTDRGGLLTLEKQTLDHCAAGDVIATLRNPFGQVVAQYTTPHDCVVIGHSVDPVAETGARIAHVGTLSPDQVIHVLEGAD